MIRFTFGHLDIIRRSAVLVDELIVGVLTNSAKTPLFSAEERVNILADVTKDIGNVTIKAFDGLSVDFARNCGAQFMVRGLRAITDFDYELRCRRPTASCAQILIRFSYRPVWNMPT